MLEQTLWAPRAWIAGCWQEAVLLEVDAQGCWGRISDGVRVSPAGARRLHGPLLPGLVNAHSHAFQRAFAGLSERRETDADDFWSWRDRMYRVALRITPEQLRGHGAHLLGRNAQGHTVHAVAPGPEVVGIGFTPLRQAREGALERVTMRIDKPRQQRPMEASGACWRHPNVAADASPAALCIDLQQHGLLPAACDPGARRPQGLLKHRVGTRAWS